MKRPWLPGLVLVGLCLGAVLLFTNRAPGTSAYQGRTVRVWVLRLSGGDSTAEIAIKAMAPAVVPELALLLQAGDSVWQHWIWWTVKKLPGSWRPRKWDQPSPPDAASLRRGAARALAALGPQAQPALPQLVTAFRGGDGMLSLEASKALACIGEASVPALTSALQDPNPSIRLAAVTALGQIGPRIQSGAIAMVQSLRDPDRAVRVAAATSLSKMGEPVCLALGRLIETGDTNCLEAATKVLLQNYAALRMAAGPLRKMVRAESPTARRQAISALGLLQPYDPATIECLRAALQDPVPEVRTAAKEALDRVRKAGISGDNSPGTAPDEPRQPDPVR